MEVKKNRATLKCSELKKLGGIKNINIKGIETKMEDIYLSRNDNVEKVENSKKKIILKGLCCANCAYKIERECNNLNLVNSAHIDFISKRLFIDITGDEEKILEEVKRIVDKIEPGVQVILEENRENEMLQLEEKSDHKALIKLAIGGIIFSIPYILTFSSNIQLLIFLISYLIVGGEVLLKAGRNILKGQIFDENFLMSVATIGAFVIGQYPEGVAVMIFYGVGEYFQDLAVDSSRKSISKLMDIRPDYANIKVKNGFKKVFVEQVKIGEIIVVKPGEKIPLDGRVIKGEATLDTSALTGESLPREVVTGDDVLGGVINNNGILEIQVKKEFKDSTVAKILDLVQNASSKKATTENFITKFARYYTPIVVVSAVLLALLPPLFIQGASFSQWIYRALVFLVVSCPCALVISIPLSFFGGIGGASKNGILIKGGNYLEALNKVETVIFDKTGTLTKGIFKVSEIKAFDSSEEEIMHYAALAESYSNHPIARSILKAYEKEVNTEEILEYKELSGFGMKVLHKNGEILVGNYKLMESENIQFDKNEAAGTIVNVALNKRYLGYILIADQLKNDSRSAVEELNKMNINTVMLTGDTRGVGENIASVLGIKQAFTELLPNEKVLKLEELENNKTPKGKIIFVGDGINDAPVLARADIGIAMGGLGSDAAIEAADVVIMTDEPYKVVSAIRIGRKVNKIVWQNIVFALAVKAVILILGALGIATMWEAVFGDVGVALIAVLNSLRAMKI